MAHGRTFKPREAIQAARKLGWYAETKSGTGEYLYVAPDGRRFISQGPGRCDVVPLILTKALLAAMAALEAR